MKLWRDTAFRWATSKVSWDYSKKWKRECKWAGRKKNGADDGGDEAAYEEGRRR